MAYNCLLYFTLLQIFAHLSNGETRNSFFRKEYTYIDATKSFYRIHTIERTWQDAIKRCEIEGATLFIPEDQKEADAVVAFWKRTRPPFVRMWVGISCLKAKGDFNTIDGRPISKVFHKFDVGEPNNGDGGTEDCVCMYRHAVLHDRQCRLRTSFICKKTLESLEWNTPCDIPDPGYIYNDTLGKCYKVHVTPQPWREAYSVCRNEQSYIAIVNSQKEADHLVQTARTAPQTAAIVKDYQKEELFVGIHNWDDEGWTTLKSGKLEDTGYAKWAPGQPDGGRFEKCGTMTLNDTLLNDISCDEKRIFICEHDLIKQDTK